jgi:hypothetical protein
LPPLCCAAWPAVFWLGRAEFEQLASAPSSAAIAIVLLLPGSRMPASSARLH